MPRLLLVTDDLTAVSDWKRAVFVMDDGKCLEIWSESPMGKCCMATHNDEPTARELLNRIADQIDTNLNPPTDDDQCP